MKKISLKQSEEVVTNLKKIFNDLHSTKLWVKLVLYFSSLIILSAVTVFFVNIARFKMEYTRISKEREINLVNRVSSYVVNYFEKHRTLYNIEENFYYFLNREENYRVILDDTENNPYNFKNVSPIFSDPLVVKAKNGKIIFSNIENAEEVTKNLKAYPVLYNYENSRTIGYIFAGRLLVPKYNSPKLIGPLRNTFFIISIFSLIILIGILCLSFWIAYTISKPIQLASIAAKKIAKNDFSVRIDINRKDEVGELANSFNIMAQKLQEANESRIQMAADISHELRTPIALINSRLELIKEGIYKFNKKNLNLLILETEKIATLIQELHETNKMEAGSLNFIFKKEELNKLSEIAYQTLKPYADEKKINFTLKNIEEKIYINCDSTKILQVLNNIISNAINATESNKNITVEIKSRKDRAFILINDEGVGIDEKDLSKIFERFYKVDRARSRQNSGSGLGLSICKSIIKAHNGNISVESKLGVGTTFKIDLSRISP